MIAETTAMIEIRTSWLDLFSQNCAQTGCSPATIKAYRQDLSHFAAWFEAHNCQEFKPELITGVDLRLYRTKALENKIAPATFNRRRITLRRLCHWAFERGDLAYDPFQGVEEIPAEEPPPRWLNSDELHKFTRAIELNINGASSDYWNWQAIRDQAIIALMLYAGLRESEVCTLDWDDLIIGQRKGRVIVRRGKGDKKREVPLNAEARRSLNLWRQLTIYERDFTKGEAVGALFVGKGGKRISTRLVQKRTAALRRLAGLDTPVTPHALRHTFAKRLLDHGTPLTVVSKLLGHARLETTARYVQPGWEDFERAVEKL
jgi:site-specific recombinase XerD